MPTESIDYRWGNLSPRIVVAVESPNVVAVLAVFAFAVAKPCRSMTATATETDRLQNTVSTVETIIPERPGMNRTYTACQVPKDGIIRI
jgi:hypothetical protein